MNCRVSLGFQEACPVQILVRNMNELQIILLKVTGFFWHYSEFNGDQLLDSEQHEPTKAA